jgi:hypothetical protein
LRLFHVGAARPQAEAERKHDVRLTGREDVLVFRAAHDAVLVLVHVLEAARHDSQLLGFRPGEYAIAVAVGELEGLADLRGGPLAGGSGRTTAAPGGAVERKPGVTGSGVTGVAGAGAIWALASAAVRKPAVTPRKKAKNFMANSLSCL